MTLNTPSKIILGILTFLPLLFAICIFGLFIVNIATMLFSENPEMPMKYLSYLGYLLPYVFSVILISLGLFIFYIVHTIQNTYLDSEKRILWIVVLFILFGIAAPIYWYLHVWRSHSQQADKTDKAIQDYYEPGTQP